MTVLFSFILKNIHITTFYQQHTNEQQNLNKKTQIQSTHTNKKQSETSLIIMPGLVTIFSWFKITYKNQGKSLTFKMYY